MGRTCSTHLRYENLKGRDRSEDLGADGMIILECILGICGGKVWTGCVWLRTETSGGRVP
jgi:hypothetical protein